MKRTLKRVISCLCISSILFLSSVSVLAENADIVNDATVVVENGESTEIIENSTEDTLNEGNQEDGEISVEEEIGLEENHDSEIALLSTGTYYAEYGIYFDTSTGTITDADENITNLKIPNEIDGVAVTSIGDHAFMHCGALSEIVIGNRVKHINSSAFENCIRLTNIVIPNSVISIGNAAFSGCHELKSILLPDSVTTIGNRAFDNTAYYRDLSNWVDDILYIGNHLISVSRDREGKCVIREGTKTIANYAFLGCTKLNEVEIPESVFVIGSGAFCDCIALTNVTIPAGTANINEYAFKHCTGLINITISSSVTYIGERVFWECVNLNNINVDVKNMNYSSDNGNLFNKNKNQLIQYAGGKADSSYKIPDFVTNIGQGAFAECKNLTDIEIGCSIVNIAEDAFYNCERLKSISILSLEAWCSIEFKNEYSNPLRYASNLYVDGELTTNIVIPTGISSINEYAFYFGASFNSITIPNSVTSIGKKAFTCCKNLKCVTIPDSVTIIGDSAFSNCDNLTSVLVGNGVTTIGKNSFYYCTKLKTVTLKYGIINIEDHAFSECRALTSIIIPDSVINIGNGAFFFCTALSYVKIGKSVEEIGGSAFYDCTGLTSINIPDSVTNIGERAFFRCLNLKRLDITSLNAWYNISFGDYSSNPLCYAEKLYLNGDLVTDLVIPGEIKVINDYAFNNGKCFESVIIHGNVSRIGKHAFSNCTNLNKVLIYNGVTSIGECAFEYCKKLKNIIIPNSVTNIGSSAFSCCDSLKSVNLPNGITSIEYGTFYSCDSLKNIVITNGVTSIWQSAFQYCYSLESITIPTSLTYVEMDAFSTCEKLTDVYYMGSGEEWKKISIGRYNYALTGATKHYNYTGNYEYDVDSSIDEYIIGEVKKYTSSGDYAQFDAIMSSNTSYEEKFRRLNELFANAGLTDIKEGIEYLSESTSYRSAYRYLTTNEIYCAFNYFNWLNTTKEGLAARSALYASGLIFNFEAFSYMDLSTYTENDYPGVKKNKKLLKEIMGMDGSNVVCDTFDYSNKVVKFLKNILKLNDAIETDELLLLKNQILNTNSIPEKEKLLTQYCDTVIKQIGDDNGNGLYFLSDNFSDILNTTGTILDFGEATAEDIVSLAKLDADIEIYKKYSRFLNTIYNTPEVSFEMRLAAYQLLDDIENGFYNKAVALLTNVIKLSGDLMYTDKSLLKTFLESQGISESGSGLFADALGTLKLATTISNIIVDTGDFVEQIAYTQGYAELATLYGLQLEEDKQVFLANETAENAWKFFEDYTMLWKLRYNGEQQYLDMSKVKMFIGISVPTYKYDEKEDVVKDTMQHLNECKFQLAEGIEIPSSVQYEKKSVVKCPVDVYVYNSDGTLIATLKDGQESDITNEYGRFTVVKESYSGEYAKVICQSTTEDLTIKMIAVDDGLVDYQSLTTASTDVKSMDKLMVGTGNSIDVNNDSYSVDTNSDGNADINGTLIIKDTNSYVAIESLAASEDNITLITGQTKAIGVTITPENTTNTALEWISLDKGVATVQNGLIKATGSGTTTIIVRACDSNEIECEIAVTVLDKMEYEVLSHICNENSLEAEINVKNNIDSKMVATMYVAIYGSDGIFKDVSLTPIELDANGETVKDVKIENYVYTKDDYIKIFIWDENLTPFCKIIETLLVSVENDV